MSQVSGLVDNKSRAGTGIRINGVWYNGTKSQLENVAWKSQATIEVGDGNKIISVLSTDAPPASAPAAQGGGGSAGNDWEARQAVIVYQSARNAAIQAVEALVGMGAVKLPAKEADRFKAAMTLIDDITLQYHTQAMSLYGGTPAEEILVNE